MATSPPDETDTPEPTNTPTAPPTNTPRPSSTPEPESSPTQEISTLVPTIEPTKPPLKVCALRAAHPDGAHINIRALPSLAGTVVTTWAPGIEKTLLEFRDAENYLWARSDLGWSVIRLQTTGTWWVAGTAGAGECEDVIGWPDDLTPPVEIARELTGFHLIVGANNTVEGYSHQIGNMKATTHTAVIAREMKAINPDMYIIYRSLHTKRGMVDCPEAWQWTSTATYWTELKPFLEYGFDWYEFENECDPVSWTAWEQHSIEMLTYMARDGYCGLFGSFGPGWPPFEAWPHVMRVLQWIDNHPCSIWPDGSPKYHGHAYHSSGMMPPGIYVPPGSYLLNEWITRRDVKFNDWLKTQGYSLEQFKGPVFVTELGWSDYSIPNYIYSCEETAAGWAFTRADYIQNRTWITGVNIWTLTRDGDPRFTNLTPCLPQIFAALQPMRSFIPGLAWWIAGQ